MKQKQWRALRLLLGVFGICWTLPALSAQRIVSTDGAVTEIIFALDAQDQLVGVDTTSLYPDAARKLPSVGYRRTLTAEGLLALNPDAIITTPESGPADTLQKLEQSGVCLLKLPDVQQPQDLLQRVDQVARWLGREEAGQRLQQQLQIELQQVQSQLPLKEPPAVLFLLAAGNRGVMVAGNNTQAQRILDALGLTNLAAKTESYKPLNQEALVGLQPQLVLVAETQPGAFDLAQWPALAATPAGQAQRVLAFDSMYLLGMGPRLPAALAELVARIRTKAHAH